MPVFEYRAKHSSGKKTSGTVVAETPRQARDQLRKNGFAIEVLRAVSISDNAIVPNSTSSPRNSLHNPLLRVVSQWLAHHNGRRLSKKVSWFTREMATLLRVGTPMVDALKLSIDQAKGTFRNYLLDIRGHIVSGNSLGSALRRHPNVFDSVLCEMITVGEQSGALQSVLLQAAEYREQKDKLKDRVLSALLYPALVFVLSIFVTVFLMTVVVPTLISSLVEMQRELPWPTRVLKFASDTLLQYGTILLAGGSIAIICFAVMARRELGRKAIDRMLLRMPLVGNLIVKQDSARLCMVTATLVKSGVELVRALEISQRAVRNSVIARVISDARDKVASGSELGTALSSGAVLPPALVQVFSLGQNTGQLEELLFQLANDYNHQVNTLADRLTTIMEPVLIVGLSIIVGFILMATLLPILETGNALTEI
jgi:type II secretory pathway component PulF